MKRLLIILLFGNLSLAAQESTDSIYNFDYRLEIPSLKAYYYIETDNVYWLETEKAFPKNHGTLQYNTTIFPLTSLLQPAFNAKITLLNSNKEIIKEIENTNMDDSIQINMSPFTHYIVFDANFRIDTVQFISYQGQIPTKLTLIAGTNNQGLFPVLKCKRRLTPLEMQKVYDAIRFRKRPEIEKFGICQLMFEI